MIVNGQSLSLLTQAVRANFMTGLGRVVPNHELVAMTIPSSTGENIYPYFRDLGSIREWVGDRVIQNLAQGDFRIKNKSFESTQAIKRIAIEDDTYGVYSPVFEQMGLNVADFPGETVWSYFKSGFTTLGPDGQYFFDVDHPVGLPGAEVSTSNFMGGSGTPWYLVDNSKVFKPVIWQPRKAFDLQTFFNADDERVFWQDQFVWGVDGRAGVGFSPFWQLAFASRQTLDATNLRSTLTAMSSQKNDAGKPLPVEATHLVVPPSLYEVANDLVTKELIGNGETNTLRGRLTVVKNFWLS